MMAWVSHAFLNCCCSSMLWCLVSVVLTLLWVLQLLFLEKTFQPLYQLDAPSHVVADHSNMWWWCHLVVSNEIFHPQIWQQMLAFLAGNCLTQLCEGFVHWAWFLLSWLGEQSWSVTVVVLSQLLYDYDCDSYCSHSHMGLDLKIYKKHSNYSVQYRSDGLCCSKNIKHAALISL